MAGNLTAVVCDDDPMLRKLASMLLEQESFDVVAEVDTAYGAIEATKLAKPDVLVLDLSLPDFPGERAAETIRDEVPECTVVLWSGFDSSIDHEALGALWVPKAEGGLASTLSAIRASRAATRATLTESRLAHLARQHRPCVPMRPRRTA